MPVDQALVLNRPRRHMSVSSSPSAKTSEILAVPASMSAPPQRRPDALTGCQLHPSSEATSLCGRPRPAWRVAQLPARAVSRFPHRRDHAILLGGRARRGIGDISRFPSADCLASYAGTASIEASSGDVIRHRLSRHGIRQLNHAIHLAAHVQTIHPGPGRDYYQRRRNTGNSRPEALRLLKRQLTKSIYRTLLADAARTHHNAAA